MLSCSVRGLILTCALLAPAGLDAAGASTSLAAGAPVSVSLEPAGANGAPIVGPGYFVLHMQAGKTRHLRALLSSHGGRGVIFEIAPVDAVWDSVHGISYNLASSPRRLVGAWIQLRKTKFRLAAHASALIELTLQVPRSARAGTYIGALTAFVPLPKRADKRGETILVQTRLADAVVVTVGRSRSSPRGSARAARTSG
jgi:hypothetical protein